MEVIQKLKAVGVVFTDSTRFRDYVNRSEQLLCKMMNVDIEETVIKRLQS